VDRQQAGPLNVAGTDPFDSQLALVGDTQNGTVEVCTPATGRKMLQQALSVIPAQSALNTITTAQTLFTKTYGAGFLNVLNRTLLISGYLIYTSPGTTTPTISIALAICGTTVCTITTAGVSSTASTNMPIQFEFEVTVTTTGSSGAVEAHGNLAANISANTPSAAVADYADTNTATVSVNLTSTQTVAATIAASSTISSAQLRLATIEVVA
jgi:hypothetical protein